MNSIYEDDLEKLITLSEKILKLYNELYTLEIDNKKDSKDYKTKLSYLYLLIEMEDEIYPKLDNSSIEYYINIIKETNSNINLSDLSVIINDKNETLLLKRILNRLRLETRERLITTFQNEYDIYTANSFLLNQLVYEDILNSFLFEIELSFKEIKKEEYLNALKMIKYIVSFLNKHIENKLASNFDISNILIFNSNVFKDIYDIEDNDYIKVIRNHYNEYINKEISQIGKSDIYNSSYSFEEYKGILQRNLVKAYLNLDKENILLKKKIYDKILEDNAREELLTYQNPKILNIKGEKIEVYGSSKRL